MTLTCSSQEERPSFLKKRSKKLLDIGTRASQKPKPHEQKFFGSFFSKKNCLLSSQESDSKPIGITCQMDAPLAYQPLPSSVERRDRMETIVVGWVSGALPISAH